MKLPELAHPGWLLAGLAFAALAELLRRRRGGTGRPALPFAFAAWLEGLPRGIRARIRSWLPAARLLLLVLLALAAAGPSLTWQARTETRLGADLVVALDASSSMTLAMEGAFASSRFDAARAAALEFVRRRPDDRAGLVAFARFPRVAVPLTWDRELFAELLARLRPVEAGSEEDRTAIGVALAEGAERLTASGGRARALVLVTDGANNLGPISPEEGVRLCQDARVRVYAIGLGGSGPDPRFGVGAAPPDLALLARIAEATGGRSFQAADAAALADACRAIDQLETSRIALVAGERAAPLASPLLALALLARIGLSLLDRAVARSLP